MKVPQGMKCLTLYVTVEEYQELQMMKNYMGIAKNPDFYKVLLEVGFYHQSNGRHLGNLLEDKEQEEVERHTKLIDTGA